jgi:hypothetical protein
MQILSSTLPMSDPGSIFSGGAARDRVSEWERLRITHHYYRTVTGETDKSIETLSQPGSRAVAPRPL